jgi:flavin reductase (DIM6/NTAB) family NADH-FMN oxidoreductase RutF
VTGAVGASGGDPADESDLPPTGATNFDQARFREVLGHFATGVTVVTAMEDGEPVGFTCQSFTSLSMDPPMVALAPAKSSTSWPRIARAGAFCVNILSDRQEAVCRTFAVSGGDKFSGIAWHVGPSGTPVLEGSLAWVACKLEMVHDAGDHELVIGRVTALDVEDGRPLLFYRAGFGSFTS